MGSGSMQLDETTIRSGQDQLPLSVWLARPEGKAKGIVQIAHGMSEHKERYEDFIRFLCGHGFVVLINDHRGHGQSVRTKDDLGYFYENGGEALVEDLHQLTGWVRERYPKLPFFLFGHSMGSLAVRAYAKKYDRELDGLMVCGCPSYNPAAKMGRAMVRAMAKLKGDRYRSQKMNHMMFGAFNTPFQPADSEFAWLSVNEENVTAYDADELCGFIFTLNGFESLLDIMLMVYDPKGWKMERPGLPVWFLSGEQDPCLTSKERFLEAVGLMKKVGYQDVTYKLYDGLRHEILNEKCKETIYQDILEKLEEWAENIRR